MNIINNKKFRMSLKSSLLWGVFPSDVLAKIDDNPSINNKVIGKIKHNTVIDLDVQGQ